MAQRQHCVQWLAFRNHSWWLQKEICVGSRSHLYPQFIGLVGNQKNTDWRFESTDML